MEENNFVVNEENYLNITLQDVMGAVGIVKEDFDNVAAQNLIRYFYYMLRNEHLFERFQLRPVEQLFVEYVVHAFARVVEQNKSTNVAFGLTPGRGEHRRKNSTERDDIAAAYVILLMRENWRYEDAKGIVANYLFPEGNGEKGLSVVEKAYAARKDGLASLVNKALLQLLPDDLPPIRPFDYKSYMKI